MRTRNLLLLTCMSMALVANTSSPAVVEASSSPAITLAITPMQCTIERIQDGVQEVVRITPASCQKAINIINYN